MERLDIVIIGAGWHGLAMAKTYLEVNPDARMAIFDTAASVGGVWAKERLYPGLKTNNLLGTYEFGDFPMTVDRFGVKPGQHIPGEVVHDYLTQFAEHFELIPRMRLSQRVESAELLDQGDWLLYIIPAGSEQARPEAKQIKTQRLVVATGLTSEPHIPTFIGQESFDRDLFHAIELRQRAAELENAKQVAVLGGNKSAWDACFMIAKSGIHVHMIIRPSGGGPSWLWPVWFSSLKLSIQRVAATRLTSWFDPCIWAERSGVVGWIRYALHRTFLGRCVVSRFWRWLEHSAFGVLNYDAHPETRKLKPWVSPFWVGNSLSIHNYSSPWLGLVREGLITVHVADVASLSEGTVHLSNNEDLQVDALVCCTGWKTTPPIRFLPDGLTTKLGLSHQIDDNRDLIDKSRTEILTTFPSIRGPPERRLPLPAPNPILDHPNDKTKTTHRYQLYRFMIPPHAPFLTYRNIAFIGAHLSLTAIIIAQLQALWITAYFMNEIPHLQSHAIDHNTILYETILHNEYTRIRHPHCAGGSGERCPDLAFDCVPYMDLLAGDLGVRKYRKGGWWREVSERYMPRDWRGVVQEWLDMRKREKGEEERMG